MAIYLIDYENVKTGGLNGISLLTDTDRVIIFYSENANRLTFDLHQRLMASTAQIEYREVTVGGHNALDFQLVTYLGFLIAQNPHGQYLIISNDRGFEHVVNFWRKDGLHVWLLSYLKDPAYALQKATCSDENSVEVHAETETESSNSEEATVEETAQATEAPAATVSAEPETAPAPAPEPESDSEPPAKLAELRAMLDGSVTDNPDLRFVAGCVEKYKTKIGLNNALVKRFGTQKAGEIYHKIKSLLSDKKASDAEMQPKVSVKQDEPAESDGKQPSVASAAQAAENAPAEPLPEVKLAELRTMLGDSVADDPELRFVVSCVGKYKTKLGLNNALVKRFGNQKAGEIYQKLKPLLSAKKASGEETKPKASASKPKQPKKEKAAVS